MELRKDDNTTQGDIMSQAMDESKNPKTRRLIVGLGVLALVLFALTVWLFWRGYSTTRDQAEAGTSLAQQVKDACADPSRRTGDIVALCNDARDVVDSGEAVGVKGDKGDAGAAGAKGDKGDKGDPGASISQAQVARAVSSYCAGGRCKGSGPTANQISAAVSIYCNSRGQCRGPEGTDGVNGQNGTDGTDGQDGAPGPQGPGPSDNQVQQAVADYCSVNDRCRGPQGPQGETGVVDVNSTCDAPDLEVIDQVLAEYIADSKTIKITCTYKADITPGNPN